MQDFRKLKVWQNAHEATLSIYSISQSFPSNETYGLTNQLRRAASSVPANISEGCGCESSREFGRFLQIAFRSASETEYHLLLAHDLGYLRASDFDNINQKVVGVKRMLSKLITKLKADN